MDFKLCPWAVMVATSCFCAVAAPPAGPQAPPASRTSQAPPEAQTFTRDYSKSPSWFPEFLRPYEQEPVPRPVLENSPRLKELIHDGKLELSLADALALALENNLDIAVQRYLRPVAQTDLLRTRSGQAARGIPGAAVPAGLNIGAIGVGVNQSAGTGGVGAAGGITGGGGAIQIPQVGTFDPALSFTGSWDRNVSPLNTVQVAGVPTVTTYSTALSTAYTQLFPDGTSYFLGLSGLRQSTTQQFLRFNPAVISRFAAGFNKPLLSGRGRLPNERFLMVAQNNLRASEEVFRLQVTNTIVQVEDAYWDLAASREAVRVAEQSLAVARALYQNNKEQAEVGTMARLDVITAQAQIAASERDVVVAQTNLQLSQTQLKNMLSKRIDSALDAAEIVLADPMPLPQDGDVPDLQQALESAVAHRPDLYQAQNDLQNQNIAIRFTQNGMRPQASIFGLYAGSGLEGNTLASAAGAGDSLHQAFAASFPEYGSGMSLFMFLRNRSAQADNLRAQLEADQLQVALQRSRQQIGLEVRQAITGLIQGRAQLQAAHEATELARQVLDSERMKLEQGISNNYEVILRNRDLVAAQQAEVGALDAYAKALVEMDRARGITLERNDVEMADALTGVITKRPRPPMRRVPRPPGFQP